MAGRLRAEESGVKGVRRIVRSQAKKAGESLGAQWPPADDAIHETRKRIRRARAALRLLRKALGHAAFRRQNEALRDAARPLSEIRDGKILVEALDDLAKNAAARDRRALMRLRTILMARRMRARRRILGSKKALEPILDALRSAGKHGATSGRPHGWSVLGPGQRRVYRAGRRAWAVAVEAPTDEHLHELRKQAKYLWHELQFLRPIQPAAMAKLASQAHQLSDRLGHDHDLAVLRQKVVVTRSLARSAVQSIVRRIDRDRKMLQAQALSVGGHVYSARPRDFVERLGTYWRQWRTREHGRTGHSGPRRDVASRDRSG